MDIRESLRAGSLVPQVPFFAQLLAGACMSGARCIPEEYWDRVAQYMGDDHDEADGVVGKSRGFAENGWTWLENHRRSEDHEVWQSATFEKLVAGAADKTVWFIPVDEFLCMYEDDECALDFVNLSRWVLVGTEEELRKSLDRALSHT